MPPPAACIELATYLSRIGSLVGQTIAKRKSPSTAPRAFDIFVKEHALKILIDYARSTGKRWTAIRDEILVFATAQPTPDYQMITRQDFESWAKGRSILGDRKFGHVFSFLTHPQTLARPELSHAAILREPMHLVMRTARALDEFYGGPFEGVRLASIAGLYRGFYGGRAVYLSLNRLRGENVFVAHLLELKSHEFDTERDWNFTRSSGYATFGNTALLHLRNVLSKTNSIVHFSAKKTDSDPISLFSLHPTFIDKSLEIVRGKLPDPHLPVGLPPRNYLLMLDKAADKKVEKLIDNFRWRI